MLWELISYFITLVYGRLLSVEGKKFKKPSLLSAAKPRLLRNISIIVRRLPYSHFCSSNYRICNCVTGNTQTLVGQSAQTRSELRHERTECRTETKFVKKSSLFEQRSRSERSRFVMARALTLSHLPLSLIH